MKEDIERLAKGLQLLRRHLGYLGKGPEVGPPLLLAVLREDLPDIRILQT